MPNELTDLDLGEWSICIDPANEDSTIEIVKSQAGLAPVLKETDMSDHIDANEGAGDADFDQFASDVLDEFNGLSAEEQAEAIVAMAAENAELESAVEDATAVVKALTESTVAKEKHDAVLKTLEQAGQVIEKMKAAGHVGAEEGSLVSEIRKSLGGGDLTPEAEARLSEVEKSLAATAEKEAIAKAKSYGFGDANVVAALETKIRKSLGGDLADKFVALIKQAGGMAAKSGLLKAIGDDAGSAGDATSHIAKAKAGADEIRKANPGLSQAQADARYWAENPQAYVEMRQGQGQGQAA